VYRLPSVSPTSSVPPSGVITMPLGNCRPSAATDTVPSGSIRFSDAVAASPPPIRSKPKSPTSTCPRSVTTRSLRCPPQCAVRSAWVDSVPSAYRSTRWSFIDTTTSEPSGSQPSPEGCCSTSTTTVSAPSGVTRLTVCR
jgi:hypothetical protein